MYVYICMYIYIISHSQILYLYDSILIGMLITLFDGFGFVSR